MNSFFRNLAIETMFKARLLKREDGIFLVNFESTVQKIEQYIYLPFYSSDVKKYLLLFMIKENYMVWLANVEIIYKTFYKHFQIYNLN